MTQSPPPITLRRANPRDADATAELMAHPEVQANTMQMPYANPDVWRVRLGEIVAPGKTDVLLVAEQAAADGTPQIVGMAGLHATGPALRRRHVMSLGISIAAPAQGRGVGQQLMQALCDYADRWAQVLRIELTVYADNARAIRLYERCGFRHEGRHTGYALRDGHYVDALSMARLHPRPPTWGAAPMA